MNQMSDIFQKGCIQGNNQNVATCQVLVDNGSITELHSTTVFLDFTVERQTVQLQQNLSQDGPALDSLQFTYDIKTVVTVRE